MYLFDFGANDKYCVGDKINLLKVRRGVTRSPALRSKYMGPTIHVAMLGVSPVCEAYHLRTQSSHAPFCTKVWVIIFRDSKTCPLQGQVTSVWAHGHSYKAKE